MPRYFSSEQALNKLRLFFSLEYDLLRHAIGYCPLIPRYEDKCRFVRHVYEDLKRARSLRERVQDFGVAFPEKRLDASWTNLVRHLMSAQDADYFIPALYRVIKVEQAEAYRTYLQHTLRLNDAPSVDVFEDHLPALEKQLAWGKQYFEAGDISAAKEQEIERFEDGLREHIRLLGSLYGGNLLPEAASLPDYEEFVTPTEMELEPRFVWRSAERIQDAVYKAEEHPAHHSYTHFTELPVIDLVANIVYDGRHMPFEYIADFIRQCWDEVRHSQMGFSRLRSMGINPYEVPIPVGHYTAYTSTGLLERIAALTQVGEACSFVPKKQWIKMAVDQHDLLTALEHDFDVVDEKNHVKFGSKWMKELISSTGETRDFKTIVADAEWKVREAMNELKKQKGEKWEAELGPRFESCQGTDSPLNLAPNIIIA
ncbi:DUF455 family protein [Paenibacillus spongiae]|uniref:DUF455 family protein n=1 Tax=Paenibacillus spongiae TaxID=2909671 RepID=A0ABY5SAC7_9BACL|nr:DUF455 family protein [Paenibacillus spongiae]UVI29673.1 DUF455 family protein [Paenibacillus spongiae]